MKPTEEQITNRKELERFFKDFFKNRNLYAHFGPWMQTDGYSRTTLKLSLDSVVVPDKHNPFSLKDGIVFYIGIDYNPPIQDISVTGSPSFFICKVNENWYGENVIHYTLKEEGVYRYFSMLEYIFRCTINTNFNFNYFS